MTTGAPQPAGRRSPRRHGVVLGLLGASMILTTPGLAGAATAAAAAPPRLAFGSGAAPSARAYADLRAAMRPGVLALQAAHGRLSAASRSAPVFATTTTYYALQPDDSGGATLVRFRTDGRAHVRSRHVVAPGSPEGVTAPTSAVGGTLLAMQAGYAGQNIVVVDRNGRSRRLTNDGRSSYGMLTPDRRVVFVTNNAQGEADGLAEVDLVGHHRRLVFHENDRDAVLSLPALSPSGRTAYLVRNVFDRRGLPQSTLLTIDVRTGRSSSRPLPGVNYVASVSASGTGRQLAFVGYRAADNQYVRSFGFRAEADVIPVVGGTARRVSWVSQPFVVFSRGGSRLIVGTRDRLVSVGVSSSARDELYGTEGLSLPVLAR
ncbi:MAG TPA: hypothetical protein VLR26_09490 [Frankiaceae bacterium]|nr:hypothetical protein [Frankiaceae bacterium]